MGTPEMPDEESRHAAETLKVVAERLAEVSDELKEARKESVKKDRQLAVRLYLVVIGFAIDVILTGVIGIVLSNQVTQSDQISSVQGQTHANQIDACNIGNQFRAQQKNLWFQLIALSNESAKTQPPPTPSQAAAQKKVLQQFAVDLNEAYAPLDCAKIYHVH